MKKILISSLAIILFFYTSTQGASTAQSSKSCWKTFLSWCCCCNDTASKASYTQEMAFEYKEILNRLQKEAHGEKILRELYFAARQPNYLFSDLVKTILEQYSILTEDAYLTNRWINHIITHLGFKKTAVFLDFFESLECKKYMYALNGINRFHLLQALQDIKDRYPAAAEELSAVKDPSIITQSTKTILWYYDITTTEVDNADGRISNQMIALIQHALISLNYRGSRYFDICQKNFHPNQQSDSWTSLQLPENVPSLARQLLSITSEISQQTTPLTISKNPLSSKKLYETPHTATPKQPHPVVFRKTGFCESPNNQYLTPPNSMRNQTLMMNLNQAITLDVFDKLSSIAAANNNALREIYLACKNDAENYCFSPAVQELLETHDMCQQSGLLLEETRTAITHILSFKPATTSLLGYTWTDSYSMALKHMGAIERFYLFQAMYDLLNRYPNKAAVLCTTSTTFKNNKFGDTIAFSVEYDRLSDKSIGLLQSVLWYIKHTAVGKELASSFELISSSISPSPLFC